MQTKGPSITFPSNKEAVHGGPGDPREKLGSWQLWVLLAGLPVRTKYPLQSGLLKEPKEESGEAAGRKWRSTGFYIPLPLLWDIPSLPQGPLNLREPREVPYTLSLSPPNRIGCSLKKLPDPPELGYRLS